MSLRARLEAHVAAVGPMTAADYMEACLHDPADGYYATRPAIGAGGDFLTAPMVSQMFGELIGLWAAQMWLAMGSPALVRLVEMGPGDGTLMEDLLRAGRALPGGIGHVQHQGAEVAAGQLVDVDELGEIPAGQHRMVHFEAQHRVGIVDAEQVRLRSDEGRQGHDDLLADRIDRRVRHLREILLEIGVEQF